MSEAVPQRRLRSLFRESEPGSRVNEDHCGLSSRFGWIVDGATGVSGRQRTPGRSDAAWLADRIDSLLADLAGDAPDIAILLATLDSALAEAFGAQPESQTSDEPGPAACLGIVEFIDRGAESMLRGAFLGDVVALVPTHDGVCRWTDERAKPFENRTLAAIAGAVIPPAGGPMPEAARRQIIENRRHLNRPGGFWVVHPERPWAGQEVCFKAQFAPGQPIVLATDGFMRLVDVFGVYTDASLHAAIMAGGAGGLIAELRDLERGEAAARARPHVKKHDDATVLVLAVEE